MSLSGVLMFDSVVFLRTPRHRHVRNCVWLAPLMLAALPGCKPSKTPDQLIVKGDAFEVTLQEYDQLLRQAPPVTKESVGPLRRALLEQLINQKLLAEAASKSGMDGELDTSQAIAAARRNILADAYVRNLTGRAPKPNPRDVETYYLRHPTLFANRRRFVVTEYVFRSDLPDLRTYLDVLNRGGFDALRSVLAEKLPGLAPIEVVRFSDELPDTQDNALGSLAAGSDIVYQSPGQMHLGIVRSATPEPLALDLVRARIEQTLTQSRAMDIANAAVKGLRESRHVEILNANLKDAANVDRKGATKS